jgi:hypothetical protein
MRELPNLFLIFILGLFALTGWSCEKDQLRMTVMFYDNQNPESRVTVDTLVLDSLINPSRATIDIYYCWTNFHIPYYLPTGNIYKDSAKEMECDMSKYPANVKCYMYDAKKRVVEMSVEGSGTMGTWKYKYDSLDRITNIEYLANKYSISYNGFGLLTELSEDDGQIKKRLVFSYR